MNTKRLLSSIMMLLVTTSLLLAACAPAATPTSAPTSAPTAVPPTATVAPSPTPVPPTSTPEEPFTVLATGLDNPRGLAFGSDGALYVVEAGKGGDGACIPNPDVETACYGATGAITRILNGKQERIIEGLPSIAAADGSTATGAHDISLGDESVAYLVTGLAGDPALRTDLGEAGGGFGQLIEVNLGSGTWNAIADIAGFEASDNPDQGPVDTNPYSVLAGADGIWVIDAGGNSLLQVDAENISVVALLDSRMVEAPAFLEMPPGSEIPMESVPTAVALGPDGAYYIAELTGFPFQVEMARIFRMEPDGDPEVFAEGFTNIIDIAFDPEGNLYVLELATNSLLAEQPAGALHKVAPDGTRAVIWSEDLIMPGGVAVGPDGALYVTNCSVCAPGEGQVVRIRP